MRCAALADPHAADARAARRAGHDAACCNEICERRPAGRRAGVLLRHGALRACSRRSIDIPLVLDFVDVDSAEVARPGAGQRRRRCRGSTGAKRQRSAPSKRARRVTPLRRSWSTSAKPASRARWRPTANVQVLANGVELDRLRPLDAPVANAARRVLRRDELRAERRRA